jgi:cystathionine beta-lyase/cystathionine gamma-synthase
MAVSHRASCARTSEQGGVSMGNGRPAPVSAQESALLIAGAAMVATAAGTAAIATASTAVLKAGTGLM